MAQAARLSLRMQKEFKLLLTDPPPGASFPLLSDSDLSSLTSIDADIAGPDGTVYENGVFRVKIQIPERYPFQPPSVTFATPIYHPNIDTGGRICLDILNLPPKGAWQPSLNISTVITSIGLLLSEPNPDDGLMCEASKEYKYNRQAFDQKARFMTQKHAKAGASGSIIPSSSDSSAQLNSLSSFPNSSMKTEGSTETLVESHCSKTTQKKSFGLLRRKLSLESSKGRSTDIAEVNKVVPDTEPGGAMEKENGNSVNQMEKMNRVEQGSSLQETAAAENTTLQVGKPKPCVIESTPPSAESSYTCQMKKELLMKPDVSGSSSRGNEKIGSRSRKLSLGLKGNSFQKFEGGNKENQLPIRKLQLSRPRSTFGTSMSPPSDLQGGETWFKGSTTDVLKPKPREKPVDEDESVRDAREDVVIVLDSEDSDDEDNRCSRRGGLLTQKRVRRSDLKFPTAT